MYFVLEKEIKDLSIIRIVFFGKLTIRLVYAGREAADNKGNLFVWLWNNSDNSKVFSR